MGKTNTLLFHYSNTPVFHSPVLQSSNSFSLHHSPTPFIRFFILSILSKLILPVCERLRPSAVKIVFSFALTRILEP